MEDLSKVSLEELIKELEKRGYKVVNLDDSEDPVDWYIKDEYLGDSDFLYKHYILYSNNIDKLYEDLKTNKKLFNDFLGDIKGKYVTEKEFIEIISTNNPLTQENLTKNIVRNLVETYMCNMDDYAEENNDGWEYGPSPCDLLDDYIERDHSVKSCYHPITLIKI